MTLFLTSMNFKNSYLPDLNDSELIVKLVHLMQVILSDGDMSTLANMKLNLELNQLRIETGAPGRSNEDQNAVSATL